MRDWFILFLLAGCIGPGAVDDAGTDPGDGDLEGSGAGDHEDLAEDEDAGDEGAGDDGDGRETAPAPEDAAVRTTWRTEVVDFTHTDAAKALGASLTSGAPAIRYNARGATHVLAELDWDSQVFDLDLAVNFEGGCPELLCVEETLDHWARHGDDGNYWVQDGHVGAPDNPVRLLIGPEALAAYGCDDGCDVGAFAWTKDVAVDVEGRLAVTLFNGAPPAGFTAL